MSSTTNTLRGAAPGSSTAAKAIHDSILRRPEVLRSQIRAARAAGLTELAEAMEVLMPSKASNDYLEKLAVESIGAVCSGKKLGADGFFASGGGVEAKPHKGKSTSSSGGCINDDSPMKLKRDFHDIQTIVFLNASDEGDRVNWEVVAPYHYWTGVRFLGICKRLGIVRSWPSAREDQIAALDELVTQHKKDTYVRSNPLSLSILADIPVSEISMWIHPDLPDKALPKILKTLRIQMFAPPTAS
jgi:hypothetical protein